MRPTLSPRLPQSSSCQAGGPVRGRERHLASHKFRHQVYDAGNKLIGTVTFPGKGAVVFSADLQRKSQYMIAHNYGKIDHVGTITAFFYVLSIENGVACFTTPENGVKAKFEVFTTTDIILTSTADSKVYMENGKQITADHATFVETMKKHQ